MRTALPTGESGSAHAGLIYERYAPLHYGSGEVKLEAEARTELLRRVQAIPVPRCYGAAYRRWRGQLDESGAVVQCIEVGGRLVLGHGNPAPTEVGLSLHQAYGVPFIAGSSLKGLCNHYLSEWGTAQDERWRGVGYSEDGRPVKPPGSWHGALFGVPNLPDQDGNAGFGQRGSVVFEDAWLVPTDQAPLTLDVLTPHQSDYYREHGAALPNDWTEPVPVTFLSVPAGARFLVAASPLAAERRVAELAMGHLLDALERWGIGSKTRAGYGRLWRREAEAGGAPEESPSGRRPEDVVEQIPDSPALQAIREAAEVVRNPPETDARPIRQRFREDFGDFALLDALDPSELPAARVHLRDVLGHRGLNRKEGKLMEALRERLG